MKRDDIEKVDKAVAAASLVLLNEAAAARNECPQLMLDVDPHGFKLEAFTIGFLYAVCEDTGLPRERATVRLVSYLLLLDESRNEDPLVALERGLATDLHPTYSPYFDHGMRSAASIVADDYFGSRYVEALREDPAGTAA